MSNATVERNLSTSICFKFDKIASFQDGFTSFNDVVLNEQGLVAFTAGRDNSTSPVGVFTGNGRVIRTIADVRDHQFTQFGKIALNDAGNVVFAAGNDGKITGIYKNYLRTNQTIADLDGLPTLFQDVSPPIPSDSPTTYNLGDNFAVNNSGNVLFSASVDYRTGASQTNWRLFLNQNQTNTKLAEANDFSISGISQTTSFTDLQINKLGQTLYARNTQLLTPRSISNTTIVFDGKDIVSAGSAPGQPFTARVFSPVLNDAGSVFYARSGSAFQTITEVDANNIYRFDTGASAPVRLSDQRIDVGSLVANDGNQVVFSGSTGGQQGLFLLDGSSITQISDRTSNNFLINNSDQIVFQLNNFEPNTSEIMTRFGSTNQRLIGSGDSLKGSTVSQVQLRGFNDAGQIAFSVNFTDGTQGVFRAEARGRSSFDSYSSSASAANGTTELLAVNQNDLNSATNPTLPSASLF
jgi:hypothetical protein